MNVVFTIVLLAVLVAWAFAMYNRLLRLRERVRDAWHILEVDHTNASAKTGYNNAVKIYNDALAAFPANMVGGIVGFKPARLWTGQ